MIEAIKITSLSGRGSVEMKSGDYLGYWLGEVDWGEVQGQHNTYSYANQVGESIVSTGILSRELSITGWVIEHDNLLARTDLGGIYQTGISSLQQRCDFLNAFISPVQDYALEYKDRKIIFRPDASVAYTPEYTANNEKVRRFLIQATCPYPLFTNLEDTAVSFDAIGNRFVFPTEWGQNKPLVFAATEKAFRVSINNTGGFSTGLKAAFKFTGDVKNPRIKNLTTDKFIGVNGTFHRGERLEFSTVPGRKYIKTRTEDGAEFNLIKYRDFSMSWIQLEPGANDLALDCDDLDQRSNMMVTVYFTPLYLEVE